MGSCLYPNIQSILISYSKYSSRYEVKHNTVNELFAGYLEGAVSHEMIFQLHSMFNALYSNSSSLNLQIEQWFETHIEWLENQVSASNQSQFWSAAGAIMAQTRGLVAGYNAHAPSGQVLISNLTN